VIAKCDRESIYDPFTDTTIDKTQLAYMVILIDLVSVVVILLYTWWLESTQKAFLQVYKRINIEVDDFTIRVKGIPH
jgi:hypothetical protein